MAEPTTPAEARRQGLRTSRWIAGGVAVGSAVVLTGTIAAVHAATDEPTASTSVSTERRTEDAYDDETEYEAAEPFAPQQPSAAGTPQQQVGPQAQTSSGGS